MPDPSIDNAVGYYGPHTLTWRLYREPLFVLGGVRALILQVAHPAVAEGVARYSNFQKDPFGRGYRTFAAMAQIYFGDRAKADATAARLQRIHDGVRGNYSSNEGGKSYFANDPELLCWVFSTLTDTTLRVYEALPFKGLPPDWREQFYEESKIAARVLGIPEGVYPPNLPAFNLYFQKMLEGDLLASTDTCREMARAIVYHPRSVPRIAETLTAGRLPYRLCERIGVPPGIEPEKRFDRLARRVWVAYKLVPPPLRYNPAWRQACYRIAKFKGEKPPVMSVFFNWLAGKMKIPLSLE